MILHIDMDAFYAAVEQLDRPGLQGRCVIVGGTSNRGVVSTASYEARRFGVHSAMPIFKARQRCPQAIFLPPRMERYKAVSRGVMDLLRSYSPLVETVSIDEAFVDLGGCGRLLGTPVDVARKIKGGIRELTALTCSVGLAPNRFLAKVASDMDKPDGFTVIAPDAVAAFCEKLPVSQVPGVGRKTRQVLANLGIQTLGDVRRCPERTLQDRLGKAGRRLKELSLGIDATPVIPHCPPKSVSSEQTLAQDTGDAAVLQRCLLKHSEVVGRQLRRLGLWARTVTLKLKHSDFRTVTRSRTLARPTQSSEVLYDAARGLMMHYGPPGMLRLVGVGASELSAVRQARQMSLFAERPCDRDSWEKVDRAMDTIQARFGPEAIGRASLKKG